MGQLVCAWCRCVIDSNYPVDGTSHGICPVCEAKVKRDAMFEEKDKPKPSK